jgi:micrococcal nuclease
MRLAPVLVLIVLIAILIATSGDGDEPTASAEVKVTRVVDGDTVEATVDGQTEDIRYIGVDTPESVKPDTPVQCYALKASHFNEDLVEGKTVRLEYDAEQRDVYGRLLAYVYLGDEFVNAELVKRGYARTLTIPPNTDHAELFARLEREASADERGLWGACSA